KLDREAEWSDDFDTGEIAELSDHEIRAVREASWAVFTRNIRRFKHETNPDGHLAEMAKAVRLLDSKWDDSRSFWFQAFRERFASEDFTPGILVSICDSLRQDVQQFGRELITSHFEDADGQQYLLKLSEHPSANLQLFATNYLERYAAGSVERLKELTPY